ncbi:hypothetical protein N473_03710 [Pseudoalteromonas luteoviolacea CPMOR-1]|uniref:Uncharacterized protein n=1 Tax=Pseudoalteromonas luteoviolacea CPMOR-1 TaxID=1365248 RepID=A0A167IES9_9GAMM|nr:hypothetical protein N473_03710 [Pseudoalteromonas luteoviolacea CPMOR-1]
MWATNSKTMNITQAELAKKMIKLVDHGIFISWASNKSDTPVIKLLIIFMRLGHSSATYFGAIDRLTNKHKEQA